MKNKCYRCCLHTSTIETVIIRSLSENIFEHQIFCNYLFALKKDIRLDYISEFELQIIYILL
jgi:hypothetical protein